MTHPRSSERDSPAVNDAEVLRNQRDANEKLVLATLRARDEADVARGAQESAEQLVDDMRETAEELRSVAEFRERLIGIVGHDLRNPLNTMLMASGLLLAHGDLGDADGRLVNRIVNSGQRMARMITQVLEFTQARLGGGFSLQLAPTDLGLICSNIVDELRLSSTAEIRLVAGDGLAGSWDADRLGAVLSNLAGNAIDHATAEGGILIDARADGGSVVVAITNHGACIPPEALPTIFKAFRRGGDDTRRNAGHMGLGLYISSEIVRAHGGTLDVRSADGSTTFTMRLPRLPPPPASNKIAA